MLIGWYAALQPCSPAACSPAALRQRKAHDWARPARLPEARQQTASVFCLGSHCKTCRVLVRRKSRQEKCRHANRQPTVRPDYSMTTVRPKPQAGRLAREPPHPLRPLPSLLLVLAGAIGAALGCACCKGGYLITEGGHAGEVPRLGGCMGQGGGGAGGVRGVY